MVLRSNVLPKTITDVPAFLFTILVIPVTYWFEMSIVLPTFHEPWTLWYIFHLINGSFILFNITSNFIAIIVYDTSVKGRILSYSSDQQQGWHFCAICESAVPPRSWHCSACNICILKRDHHCAFSACCVGHENQRYFLMFLFYVFVAMTYSIYFNSFFIWGNAELRSALSILKFVFPLAMFMFDLSINQCYLFFYLLNVIGTVFTAVLLYFHLSMLRYGAVTHERNEKTHLYDYGLKQNIKNIFGERWYLTWLSPFVTSKLPCDGITWPHRETLKGK